MENWPHGEWRPWRQQMLVEKLSLLTGLSSSLVCATAAATMACCRRDPLNRLFGLPLHVAASWAISLCSTVSQWYCIYSQHLLGHARSTNYSQVIFSSSYRIKQKHTLYPNQNKSHSISVVTYYCIKQKYTPVSQAKNLIIQLGEKFQFRNV